MGGACTAQGRDENADKILVGEREGRDHSEDVRIDGTILERILGKQGGKVWIGCIWLMLEPSGLSTRQ